MGPEPESTIMPPRLQRPGKTGMRLGDLEIAGRPRRGIHPHGQHQRAAGRDPDIHPAAPSLRRQHQAGGARA